MINNKTKLGVAAVVLSSVVSASAMAAALPGAYVGAGLGYGNVHQSVSDVDNSKDSGLAGRAFAGWQFNQYLATELGWSKFTDATFKANSPFASVHGKLKTDAVDVVVKGILPVADSFNLYAKAGAAYVMSRADASVTLFGYPANYDEKENKWFPTFGAGATYDFTPNVAADLSYSRIQKTGNSDIFNSTDLYTVGLIYSFG